VGEKGYNRTLGKSGKRYPKGSPYPVGEYESPASTVATPPRRRRIDRRSHSRRTGHALVNPAGAVATPLRYRKIDRSRRSQRTEHKPESRVGAAIEPFRYRKIDRREHNGSS